MDETLLKQALEFGRPYAEKGKVAHYIPELSKADWHDLGISVHTIDGRQLRYGLHDRRFTIQSISKIINLAIALEHFGFDAVFHKAKMEPSGAAFNSMSRISDSEDIPFNPLVNSGAIAIVDLLLPMGRSRSTIAMAPEFTRGLKGMSSLSDMRDMELNAAPEGSILALWNTASKPKCSRAMARLMILEML